LRNVRLVVEYDGTGYHGFAVQRGLRTIQGELERAIGAVTADPAARVAGSGRTDAGAHALGQVVSFRTGSRLGGPELRRALNANLPGDIVVKVAEDVADGFHARRSAQRRNYRYSLWNAELPSVRERFYRLHVAEPLDTEAMASAAQWVIGTHDFRCFTFGVGRYLASGRRRTTVRTIFGAGWSRSGEALEFDISGTAFLPHMIRNMVGSMLRVGLRKVAPDEFRRLFAEGSTELSTHTVPALGLTLVSVEY
jgi:tRNA pseudouridine38-40 synthase